jgi:hypothetical protein
MKIGLPGPNVNPAEVAIAVTTAAWLLGIPPVDQKKRVSICKAVRGLFLKISIIDFKSCAMSKLNTADKNILFLRSSPITSIITSFWFLVSLVVKILSIYNFNSLTGNYSIYTLYSDYE